jgi:hypothetical protein
MTRTPKRILVPAAIVMSLALAPVLTACANPLESLVNNVTGGQVDLGGVGVPADFPSDIPLAAGDVIFGAGIGGDEGKVWNVTIKVSSADALDAITAQMTAAGFDSQATGDTTVDAKGNVFTKEPYGVLVVVSKDDKDGFIANYTVTYTKPGS